MLQRGGAIPSALIVAVEDVALHVESDSSRGANSGAGRNGLAVRGDAETPASPWRVSVKRPGQAEDHPDIAILVRGSAEGILMVVSVNAPWSGYGDELIGPSIAVAVPHSGNIGTLGKSEPAVLVGHSQRLVKPTGEFAPGNLAEILLKGALTDPDVTAAGCEGDTIFIDYGY